MTRKNIHDVRQKTRIKLLEPLKANLETKIASRLDKYREVVGEYIADTAENKVEGGSNLTRKERTGLKRLQERIRDGQIVVTETDQTDKLVVVEMDEYLRMGEKHISKDKEISIQ